MSENMDTTTETNPDTTQEMDSSLLDDREGHPNRDADDADKTGKAEKRDKAGKAGMLDKAENLDKAGKAENPGTAEKAENRDEAGKLVGAPEAYAEFTLPADVVVAKEALAAFMPVAKELNLTQEQAQTLIDTYIGDILPRTAAEQQSRWSGTLEGWVTAAKADQEIGGELFGKNVEIARRALNTFGTPALKAALSQYGLGNHPEMIRLMVRIGKEMAEDTFVSGDSNSDRSEQEALQAHYPSMFR